jgi:hypothetical protein
MPVNPAPSPRQSDGAILVIYWDQASVLAQLGLIDEATLPVIHG